jgi:hypothetical protein
LKTKNTQILSLDEKNSLVDYFISKFEVKEIDSKSNFESENAKKLEKLKALQNAFRSEKNKKITAC